MDNGDMLMGRIEFAFRKLAWMANSGSPLHEARFEKAQAFLNPKTKKDRERLDAFFEKYRGQVRGSALVLVDDEGNRSVI